MSLIACVAPGISIQSLTQSLFLTPTCRVTQIFYTYYLIKVYSRTASHGLLRKVDYNDQGCESFFLHGGGDNRSHFTKICNLTSLGGAIFQLGKNSLKSKRKLSNFQFHVPQQC